MSEMSLSPSLQTTNVPDPWSESGYSQWHNARNVRVAWMEMMGLSRDEIEEQCEHCPPVDLDEELSQYNAMFALQEMNRRA